MNTDQLILALSKGRIFDDTLPLLAAAGLTVTENPETSRKLILATNDPNVRVIIVRASDVPTYVQYGAADFGVAARFHLAQDLRHRRFDGVVGGGLESEQGRKLPGEIGGARIEVADGNRHGLSLAVSRRAQRPRESVAVAGA